MNDSAKGSLFRNLPDATKEERAEELCRSKSFRIERIISAGQVSPTGFWFDQPKEEWVVVVQGRAEVSLLDPDETIHLSAGDWLMIEAHRKQSRSHLPPALDDLACRARKLMVPAIRRLARGLLLELGTNV